jgi:hypothetical protein
VPPGGCPARGRATDLSSAQERSCR